MASCLTDYSTCTRTHGDKRLDFGVMCCMRKEMMVCCLLSVVCCLSAERSNEDIGSVGVCYLS